MDYLKFISSWQGKNPNLKQGVLIKGIQLEGCLFDGVRLTDCTHDSPTISAVPPCLVAWIYKVSLGQLASFYDGVFIFSLNKIIFRTLRFLIGATKFYLCLSISLLVARKLLLLS